MISILKRKFLHCLKEAVDGTRKRKRKPSSGAPGNRLVTVEKNVKQAVCVKLTAETMPQPPQAQCCRSMASSRMVEIQNSVKSHIPTQLGSSTESKIEIEGATHLSNRSTVTEEKIVPKGKKIADINVNRVVNRSTGNISRTPKICRTPKTCSKSTSSGVVAWSNNVEARGQLFSANLMVAPAMEKVENSLAKYPLQSVRCSSDKYKSRSGCPPSKKQMIQKSSIHPGKVVNSGFPALAGELDDDREELLFSADFARKDSYRACSNSFWKKMECYFTSITSQDESYLKHQLDFADTAIIEAPSLHQILISAIIEADESQERSLHGEGKNDFQCASDDSHSVDQISENDISSVEDNLRVQLQHLDLCTEMHAEEEDAIIKDIIELEGGLVQQAQKKKRYIRKIYDSIQQEKHAEKRKLEQAAMSKLIEMAYKKQRVSRMSHSSKAVLRRVTKQSALPFAERTLAKCREFEETGRSCFREGALQNIIFSSPTSNSVANSVGKYGSMDKQRCKGMNRDFLPSDVCSDSSRAIPGGSAKRKRSENAKNQTTKNIFSRVGPPIVPPPVGSSADARESILKPEVKASNLLASGAEPESRSMEPTHAASDSPRMQDQDWQGLDIPMDDLSDVQFLSWF